MPFAVHWKKQKCHKIWKKQSEKQKSANDKPKKRAIYNSNKQPASPQKTATPQKPKPKFAGKPRGWQRWSRSIE